MPYDLHTGNLGEFLDSSLQSLIAEANEAGFGTEEILAELGQILRKQRLAYQADPDPADDS